ncbi:PPE domain-containing protein [Streptomyces pseudogriseolus]|uniref:PPE domain-containing protein n=1 Tax=Streptomyces pseudogriseolus TaxID=36817 RepID=UPI003FA24E59
MAITYQQLRTADLSSLSDAVDAWRRLPGQFDTVARSFGSTVTKGLRDSDWKGETATEALEKFDLIEKQMKAASDEAHDVHTLLRSALEAFQTAKSQLKAIEKQVAEDKYLKITPEGRIYCDISAAPQDHQESLSKGYFNAVQDYNRRVDSILKDADDADLALHHALTSDPNGSARGFNTDAATTIKEAEQRRKEALQDAKAMVELARKGGDLSVAQVRHMRGVFAEHEGDPLFNEKFATSLGAKGTLQFWVDLSEAHAGARGADLKELKGFQEQISTNLANATHSDSRAMQQWKQGVIDAGNISFAADSKDPFYRPPGAVGFQVMSSLMGSGKYDTGFLDDYGKALLKVDKAPAGEGKYTDEVWQRGADLVFGKETGRDPLHGYLDALSHNPEAATQACNKSNLDHLLESSKYTDRGNSLGLALEAAVTGVAHEEATDHAPPHSKRQVEIMRNVMDAVAQADGGADLVGKAGLGPSFGRMASAYMPEISIALAGSGSESALLTNSSVPQGLNEPDVARFLYEVSRDSDGKAAIQYGETIYTASLLEAHVADPSLYEGSTDRAIETVAHNSGMIQGIVGHSTADAEISKSVAAEKDYNESIKQQGDFIKTVASTGVGVGSIALIPFASTPAGALTSAAAGGFFSGVVGLAVDRFYEGKQLDGSLDDSLYRTGQDLSKAKDSTIQQAQWCAMDAIAAHDSKLPGDATKDLIRQAVNAGWTDSDTLLEDNHERPSA